MIDPIAMLKRDHREVEAMLKTLQSSKPGSRRQRTVEQVEQSLALHMEIEERLVYPLVAQIVGAEEAEEAGIEHALVRETLTHLRDMVDAPGFGAVVEMLTAGIKHHVKEEEKEVFPKLKKELSREQLAQVGEEALAMMPRAQKTKAMNASKRSSGSTRKATKKTSKRTSKRRTSRASTSR